MARERDTTSGGYPGEGAVVAGTFLAWIATFLALPTLALGQELGPGWTALMAIAPVGTLLAAGALVAAGLRRGR